MNKQRPREERGAPPSPNGGKDRIWNWQGRSVSFTEKDTTFSPGGPSLGVCVSLWGSPTNLCVWRDVEDVDGSRKHIVIVNQLHAWEGNTPREGKLCSRCCRIQDAVLRHPPHTVAAKFRDPASKHYWIPCCLSPKPLALLFSQKLYCWCPYISHFNGSSSQ